MTRPSFGAQVAIGMGAGIAAGLIARAAGDGGAPLVEGLRVVGGTFVALLRALVVPLVFTAIVASVAALRDLDGAARLFGRTLLWFAITGAIAVGVGLAVASVLQPGAGVAAATAPMAPAVTGGWLDFLRGIVPSNALGLSATTKLADGTATTVVGFNILQVIVIAGAVGAAAVSVGAAAEPLLAANAAALAVFRRLLSWVIRLTPVGSAGLIGVAVADYGASTLRALGLFAGAVYLALGAVLFVVYPILLRANGVGVARFFRTVWPAIQLGFVSRSSLATLPVTQRVTEALGVPARYGAFAVPFGATTKMDGCAAVYPAVAALFVAQYYGLALGAGDYGLIVIVSVLGSAATAGLTGAIVMLTLTLSTLGLPMEGAGLLLAIDPIIDMGRTAVNVAGQALVPTIVARRSGLMPSDEAEVRGSEGVGQQV